MTVNELIIQLQALKARDEYLGDASVTYDQSMSPVEGGIICKNKNTGLVVLNLAPVTLDKVGGF